MSKYTFCRKMGKAGDLIIWVTNAPRDRPLQLEDFNQPNGMSVCTKIRACGKIKRFGLGSVRRGIQFNQNNEIQTSIFGDVNNVYYPDGYELNLNWDTACFRVIYEKDSL